MKTSVETSSPETEIVQELSPNKRHRWFQRIDGRKLIFESILIIFSILLALFINEWRKGQEQTAQRQKSMHMILQELQHNADQLENVIPYHARATKQLDSLLKTNIDLNSGVLSIAGQVLRRGINPPELRSTAWNTAQLSGSVGLFKEEAIYALANVYELQEDGVEITWKEIARFYMSADNFDSTLTLQRLALLKIYFNELYQQEQFLQERTNEAIMQLNKY
ncbi:MAG: hypothetical protein IPJ74_02400 [Saprospiraceae bacterium]|nr:hypothetical protein [Saprospiraceae bacterium]